MLYETSALVDEYKFWRLVDHQKTSIRLIILNIIWYLVFPIIIYVRYSPIDRLKGALMRNILRPLLRIRGNDFLVSGPLGECLRFRYDETIGQCFFIYGYFEEQELISVLPSIQEGSFIDVGANVGLYSIPIASRMRAGQNVFCIEPNPSNVSRLKEIVDLNKLDNIEIIQCAAGAKACKSYLLVDCDPAYCTVAVSTEENRDGMVNVDVLPLDVLWETWNKPKIDLIKIDVEGAEFDVIQGGNEMISHCKPDILVEISLEEVRLRIERQLEEYGYIKILESNFQPWNHLYRMG